MSDTRRLWSVTTLIKAGSPTKLDNWAAYTTTDFVLDNWDELAPLVKADRVAARDTIARSRYRKSGDAAARGTDTHAYIESVLLGVPPKDVNDVVAPYCEQAIRWLEDFKPKVLASEAMIVNLTYGYAGTLDMIVELDGQVLVVDTKTTDKPLDPKKPGPPYPEVALQLVAYARAEQIVARRNEVTVNGRRYYTWRDSDPQEPMIPTVGAGALILRPDSYQFHPVRVDDTVWRAFLHVREVARWQLETSKRVIGSAARPDDVLAAAP